MKRRIFIAFLCASGVLSRLLADAPPTKPNILILLTDDQRWDAMGCAGNRIVQTPEMDRLAREGTMFVNAFVTSSICAASRASIFTGQYERAHRCNFNTGILRRAQLEQSYPMLLRRAGYHTGFIGKYGVGDGKREIEGTEVFDRWFGFYGQGLYFPKTHPGKHLNAVMVEQARDFLDGAPAGKPWCLSISFKAPHSGKGYLGYETEPDLQQLYANATIPAPPTAKQEYFDSLPEFLRRCNARTSYWEQRFNTPEQYQAVMRDYYRLITGADRAIGRIREELARRGLAQNTVILFLSDNGDMMGDYMLGGKELLHDVSIRVPLIVHDPRAPSSARGQRRAELALNIDIAPTALDLAGAPVPAMMQGRSLAPLARGERVAWREDFFCENNFCVPTQYYPMIEGVRTARWKYIRYTDVQPVHEQLFNLDADANEITDLARANEHASTLADLRRRCDELRGGSGNADTPVREAGQTRVSGPRRPNIILIMADDLGYNDLSCQGATKLKTPGIDRLAKEGVRLTDAHTPAGLCCPTRYGVLTGRYPWRRPQTCWASPGAALLIEPGRMTTASLLKQAGYTTGIVGKWHLGFGTPQQRVDWNGELKPGPLEVGFDYFFGDVSNRWGAYVENHRIVGVKPDDPIRFEAQKLVSGKSAFTMKHEENARVLHEKAVAFIERNKDKPFYLHYVPNNIHTPLTPNAKFAGTSQAGKYGDFVHELDWSVGELLATLDRLKLTGNTLVIFTSDNGGVYEREGFRAGHRSCAPFNGQKGDVWEGGNCVPFLARWPGRIAAGTTSARLLCLTDMLATFAALTGQTLPADAGPDSFNALPALFGKEQPDGARTNLVVQARSASVFRHRKDEDLWAVRDGNWKLVMGQGSGYSTEKTERAPYLKFAQVGMVNSDFTPDGQLKPDAPPGQLYDLASDPGETKNLYREHPDIVARLTKLFEQLRDAKRSRP